MSTTAPKQSEARERVLGLIEELGIGDAIPSERQLSADLGMSRLTVRAALDDLVRDGYLVRKRGSGTFVSEPKIAQELTMTSFTEDMRRRGMVPGSRTLELRTTSAGPWLGPDHAPVPGGADRGRQAPAARRRRDDGDRDAPRSGLAGSGPVRGRSGAPIVLHAADRALRHRHCRRPADDRADGDASSSRACASASTSCAVWAFARSWSPATIERTAAAIAAEAGVDDVLAEATPEDKLPLIRREQERGRLVAMSGDGPTTPRPWPRPTSASP